MNRDEIQNLATLAAITLSDSHLEQFAQEFADILAYVRSLENYSGQDIPQVDISENRTYQLRADTAQSVFEEDVADAILKQAPRSENRYIQVQAVLTK